MSGLSIREANDLDLPALHWLYQQLQPEDTTTLAEMEAGFQAMQTHPDCRVCVAEWDGVVVGTYVLYLLPNMTRNGRPAAMLENIVVDEVCRGQGIGRVMLEQARSQAQAAGCYKLSLTSNAKRTAAHDFYRKCGMVQHGVSFRYTF